jgi:hypothetical protein
MEELVQLGIMSEERMAEVEKQLSMLGKIVAVGWALLAAAFAIGAWVTTLELRTRANTDAIASVSKEARQVMDWKVSTEANRWTIQDHVKAMTPIQESISINDKRIQRLEDAIVQINKSLERIESAVRSKQ